MIEKYSFLDKAVYHIYLGAILISFLIFAHIYSVNSNILTFLMLVFTYAVLFQNFFLIRDWHKKGDAFVVKTNKLPAIHISFYEMVAFFMPVWIYSFRSECILILTLVAVKFLQRCFVSMCYVRFEESNEK